MRRAWEVGFAAWDGEAAGKGAALDAVVRAAGVSIGAARGWVESGDVALGLPSYRERVRDAVRALVASDRNGGTLESVERRGLEARVRDRAKALSQARKAETKILGDAVAQRAEEAKLVRGVRQTTTAMLLAEGFLLKGVLAVSKSLEDDITTGRLAAMKPADKVALIHRVASVVKLTAETARLAVTTERAIMGRPGTVLGGQPTDDLTEAMSPEDAEAYIAMAHRAMARRARARVVVAADGEAAE